jgi:hypothetical protein
VPNAATALVIGGFATGLGLATLVALPDRSPTRPVATLPERSAPVSAPGSGAEVPTLTLARLDVIARDRDGAILAPRPGDAVRD